MMTHNLCTVLLAIPEESLRMGHKAADEFVKYDPYGLGMALIAILIVFSVLAIVYLFFSNVSKVYIAFQNKSAKKHSFDKVTTTEIKDLEAEVSAAIGMALYMYNSKQHDMESLKITIQKVAKLYSPWNSKLYMINRPPVK